MDEMELITARLDDIKHQIAASNEQLAAKIRYGDRSVEALVTLATDQIKGLRDRVSTLEGRVEEIRQGKVVDLREEMDRKSNRNLTIFIAAVGWFIAIATIVLAVVR